LGRFAQPDTVVPGAGNPQNLNPFSYVLNNPLKHVDPSGQCIPGENCPGDMGDVSVPPAHYALTKDYTKHSLFQGDNTRDCGPTAVAMGINLALDVYGIDRKSLTQQEVLNFMNQWWTDEITGVPLPIAKYRLFVGGPTLPGGVRDAINDLAKKNDLPIHAEVKHGGTLKDLINDLQQGRPTLVLVMWGATSGHWLIPVEYDEATDMWTFLDPGSKKGVSQMSTRDFLLVWSRKTGVGSLCFSNAMVTIVEGPPPE
ncbi:MAG: hypothetical protein ACP5NB_13640, partial [Chloroflexia bacterium]